MNPISKVVIVGGGTAGWMAAASLAEHLKTSPLKITLIESTEIGTVGVGEATIPSIVNFNYGIGLNELEFIRRTQATFKLGINFEGWKNEKESFFHPFSDYGIDFNGIDFHHYFHLQKQRQPDLDLAEFSLGALLAKQSAFSQPPKNPQSPLVDYGYAYHFDAKLYAGLLKETAIDKSVEHIDSTVSKVHLNSETGYIESLSLNNGQIIDGDLFIDCTGFKGLLIEETLETGYEDWSHWLLCDSAVAVQSTNIKPPLPYTRTIAQEAGWIWQIPLQHRMGNGYVYSSRFLDKDQAKDTLVNQVSGELVNEPRSFSFKAGRRKKIWNKNCFALGLASGFIEPLESTSISLIQTGITHLLSFFPDKSFDQAMVNEVNRRHAHEMEVIRDFIILHYALSQRDTPFWQYCRDIKLPDSLKHKIEVFKSCGHLVMHEPEAFEKSSWTTMYSGFGVFPKRLDPRVDQVAESELSEQLQKMRAHLNHLSSKALSHEMFLKEYIGT